jgi:hypothetical protein
MQTETDEHHVFFTASTGTTLLQTIEQLGPWLDDNDIRPLEFKHMVTPTGRVELQLTFKTRKEASLFEEAFCQIDGV